MRQYRQGWKMTQEEFAGICGISLSYLEKIEAGRKPVPPYVSLIVSILQRNKKNVAYIKKNAQGIIRSAEISGLPAHLITTLRLAENNNAVISQASRLIDNFSVKETAAA